MGIETVGTPAAWIGFTVLVLALLSLDLGVFHRKAHVVEFREALIWSIVWISLSLLFNVGIYFWFGSERALEFLTGYLIEKALSVDNIFVFMVLFTYFGVPHQYRHRVLFWGIIGALLMRALFIGLGTALLAKFHWIIYLFGGLLVLTGVRLIFKREEEPDLSRNAVYRTLQRWIPAVSDYRGQAFFVVENGKRLATPLLIVLLMVEATDIVFAVDSIPAIFAITRDPFIVYTSNIFAILGLRALFFLLAGVLDKFHHLRYGLALVLIYVGIKMLIVDWYKIPIGLSLGAVAFLLGGSVVSSLLWPAPHAPAASGPSPEFESEPGGTSGHEAEKSPKTGAGVP